MNRICILLAVLMILHLGFVIVVDKFDFRLVTNTFIRLSLLYDDDDEFIVCVCVNIHIFIVDSRTRQ